MSKKNTQEQEPMRKSSVECYGVTGIQVYPLKETVGKTRAMVRVVLGDQLQLTGMRIVDGANGLFVAYPNDPGYKGDDYRSLFYPVTKELREHVEQMVLAKFQEVIQGHSAA